MTAGSEMTADAQRNSPVLPDERRPLSVTVVVPTRDRSSLIVDTVRALVALDYPAYEVIVCDQSRDESTMRLVSELARQHARLRYHRTAGVGISANRNAGLCLSIADIVAFADDDCIVDKDWLQVVSSEFTAAEIAGVFGRMLPYEQSGRNGTELGLNTALTHRVFSSPTPPWHVGHGGNMAFRREVLIEVGGFDPLLGVGGVLRSGEDADIVLKLFARHKVVVYAPGAVSYHKQWKDWDSQKAIQRSYGVGAGAMFAKHARLRNRFAVKFLALWIWQQGVRRVAAGLLKWRSARVVYLGYCQLTYPWIGIVRSLRYPIDEVTENYRDSTTA